MYFGVITLGAVYFGVVTVGAVYFGVATLGGVYFGVAASGVYFGVVTLGGVYFGVVTATDGAAPLPVLAVDGSRRLWIVVAGALVAAPSSCLRACTMVCDL